MPDSFHGRAIDRIKLIDNPVLQLVIRHDFTFQQGLQIEAGCWNNLDAIVTGNETLVEEDRIAACV
jgi:hypothetical protein